MPYGPHGPVPVAGNADAWVKLKDPFTYEHPHGPEKTPLEPPSGVDPYKLDHFAAAARLCRLLSWCARDGCAHPPS